MPRRCISSPGWKQGEGDLIVENLRRIIYVSWCFMCRCSSKTVDDVLLHCQVVRLCGLYYWFRMWLMVPGSVKDMLHSLSFRRKSKCRAWKIVPLAIMWVLWKEKREIF